MPTSTPMALSDTSFEIGTYSTEKQAYHLSCSL
jgi:hypothetical protein